MKYTVNLTDENIQALMDDPEMDGITLEGTATDGTKVQVTMVKTAAADMKTDATVEEPVDTMSTEDDSAELGNIAPEEEAAMMNATEESYGFTNESTISSFDNFLKTRK